MGIEFHCPKCAKLIRAPETAGGRRGKCPYCKDSVYIPKPASELDEIPLAPVDPEADAEDRRLREEARQLATAIDREEPGKYDTDEPPAPSGGSVPLPRDFDSDVADLVRDYLVAMVESDMGRADTATRQLKKQQHAAKQYLKQLMTGEIPPPEIGKVPEPVYTGFVRQLADLL